MILLLTLSLSSCSTTVETRYIVKRPPLNLTDVRPIPPFTGKTVDDLKQYSFDLIEELELNNLDKGKLQEWFDKVEKELNKENER